MVNKIHYTINRNRLPSVKEAAPIGLTLGELAAAAGANPKQVANLRDRSLLIIAKKGSRRKGGLTAPHLFSIDEVPIVAAAAKLIRAGVEFRPAVLAARRDTANAHRIADELLALLDEEQHS